MNSAAWSACAVVVGLSVWVATSDSYMDEAFHIPQAMKVCEGDFKSWDPKITTFPGLYYASCALIRTGQLLLNVSTTSTVLKYCNVVFSLLLLYFLYRYSQRISGCFQNYNLLQAMTLFLYPVSAFYYGLYYTDTLSTLSVISLLTMTHSNRIDGFNQLVLLFLACGAILVRQTNVLWVLFALGISCVREFNRYSTVGKDHGEVERISPFSRFIAFLTFLVRNCGDLLSQTWAFWIPTVGFAMFVIKNGGIVVGDKDNHRPTIHWAMLAHLCVVGGLLVLPKKVFHSQSSNTRKRSSWGWTVFVSVTGLLSAIAMVFGSQDHPFLLSDNRHYTFYLWRRFLSRISIRIALAPVYAVLTALFVDDLCSVEDGLWGVVYFVATSLSLLPTPLLEPRYLTVPVMVALLHCYKRSDDFSTALLVLLALFLLINVVTVYIFMAMPFVWHEGSVARFMY